MKLWRDAPMRFISGLSASVAAEALSRFRLDVSRK